MWGGRPLLALCFFFSSRRRHTRFSRDWSSDVCSSDLRHPSRLEKQVGKVAGSPVHTQKTTCLRGEAPVQTRKTSWKSGWVTCPHSKNNWFERRGNRRASKNN